MRILIINPPHQSIGSRMPGEMLPPLGLLSIAGPLIDDGHNVALLDADPENWPLERLVRETVAHSPEVLLIGHNGSTSAHPTVVTLLTKFRARMRDVIIIYGGVFPTYHWRDVLEECPEVDIIVRGEGEETTRQLVSALAQQQPLAGIKGLAFRDAAGQPFATPQAGMIQDLDAYRVAWELIDHSRYSYYGGLKGVTIQFSRGWARICAAIAASAASGPAGGIAIPCAWPRKSRISTARTACA